MDCRWEIQMIPIGALMIEHRLIDRLISLLEKEAPKIRSTGIVDIKFMEHALDFLIVYADRCHHGKEEEILFKQLRQKSLSVKDQTMLENLLDDHSRARLLVKNISGGLKEASGERRNSKAIYQAVDDLTKLYRSHVYKEDKQFFIPSMKYFNNKEKEDMMCAFWEFDRMLIHEKYKEKIGKMEKGGKVI